MSIPENSSVTRREASTVRARIDAARVEQGITPNIIANQSAAVTKALDLFEPQIAASDPPEVAEAAKTYVSERRLAMQKHVDHTYTQADGVSGNVALAKLK